MHEDKRPHEARSQHLRHIDESLRIDHLCGYVLAAVTVADPAAVRKVVHGLVAPGNRRLHLVDERPRRRPEIVAALVQTDIAVTVYDAARRYRSGREARSACLSALVADLAAAIAAMQVVIEQDDSLVVTDRQWLYRTTEMPDVPPR